MNTKIGIFDTHAHYNDDKFKENQDEIIKKIHTYTDDSDDSYVEYVCNIGANIKESAESIALTEKYDFIYSSVGIHPWYAENLENDWEEKFLDLCKNSKVVGIGETGLDYSKEDFSKKKQFEVFEKQLNIAESLNLPIIVHSRDAEQDTMAIIKNFPKVCGVIHCFSYDFKTAEKYIDLGYYIGFTGIVTFKNAEQTQKAVLAVPDNKIVVETDCPYMAPVPFRGKVCDSSMLKFIIQKVADIKNISYSEALTSTRQNALNLYRINTE